MPALFVYADISILYFVYIPPRKSIKIESIPYSYQCPKHQGTPRQILSRRAFLMRTTIRPMCFNFITPTGSCDVDPACIPRAEYSYNNVLRTLHFAPKITKPYRRQFGDACILRTVAIPQFGPDGEF